MLHLDPKKSQFFANITLRKKPSYSELFRSKFCRIRTEYGVIIKWLNGRVFVYKPSDWGFESRRIYLNFRYRACLEQGVRLLSGKECGFTLKCVCDIIRTYSQKIKSLFCNKNVTWLANFCKSSLTFWFLRKKQQCPDWSNSN